MKKRKERKLRKAMAMPFDEGMPIISKAICKNYALAFRADITEWCARHAKEIEVMMKEIKQ